MDDFAAQISEAIATLQAVRNELDNRDDINLDEVRNTVDRLYSDVSDLRHDAETVAESANRLERSLDDLLSELS